VLVLKLRLAGRLAGQLSHWVGEAASCCNCGRGREREPSPSASEYSSVLLFKILILLYIYLQQRLPSIFFYILIQYLLVIYTYAKHLLHQKSYFP
jgi:hypothetical protein